VGHPRLNNAKLVVVDKDSKSAAFTWKLEFTAPAHVKISGRNLVTSRSPVRCRSIDFEVKPWEFVATLPLGQAIRDLAMKIDLDALA
jgi:hypothetical protein